MLMTQLYLTVVLISQGMAWILQLARVLSARPAPQALVLAQEVRRADVRQQVGSLGFWLLTQLQND